VDSLLSLTPRGRMYRATRGGEAAAVKELVFAAPPDPDRVKRFERDGRALRDIQHPSLPRTLDVFTEGQGANLRLYLVWAFVEGTTLEQALEERRYSEQEARRAAADALEALVCLHGHRPKVLHRDIKPSNVIVRADGSHALVDFGIGRDEVDEATSGAASPFGYMSAEQLAGSPDERSDLYALGMTLLRALSRREVADLYAADRTVVFRPYVNASPAFLDFLEGLVARSRDGRFNSAARALKAVRGLPPPPTITDRSGLGPVPSTRVVPAEVVRFRVQSGQQGAGVRKEGASPIRWVQSSRAAADVAPEGRPWCVVVERRQLGLRPGCSYLVGRGDDADIRIEDAWTHSDTVSRRHVTLTVNRAGVVIRDLGSANGTMVGNMPLPKGLGSMQIREPTRVLLGRFELSVLPWSGKAGEAAG
jgi:serine/threonine protein kinase